MKKYIWYTFLVMLVPQLATLPLVALVRFLFPEIFGLVWGIGAGSIYFVTLIILAAFWLPGDGSIGWLQEINSERRKREEQRLALLEKFDKEVGIPRVPR